MLRTSLVSFLAAFALVFATGPSTTSAASYIYRVEIVCIGSYWLALAYTNDRLSDVSNTAFPCKTIVAGVEQGPSGSVDPIVEGPVQQQATTR